ncbi:hypothetical protein [Sorangium sp. So ce388]
MSLVLDILFVLAVIAAVAAVLFAIVPPAETGGPWNPPRAR